MGLSGCGKQTLKVSYCPTITVDISSRIKNFKVIDTNKKIETKGKLICRNISFSRWLIVSLTMCLIIWVKRDQFNEERTRIQRKSGDIWERLTSKFSSGRGHPPPQYTEATPAPSRIRPASERPIMSLVYVGTWNNVAPTLASPPRKEIYSEEQLRGLHTWLDNNITCCKVT